MTPDLSPDLTDGDGRFHATRWSVILSSLDGAAGEAQVREALGRLCRRQRGRFRSFLLTSLQNFLHDAHDKTTSRKRGRDQQFVSSDDWMAEAPSQFEAPQSSVESWSAEKIFDVRWAATVAERALRHLQEECAARGRGRLF